MTTPTSNQSYPKPRETPTNAPMLAAWREGVLALQKCGSCGHVIFYPRPLCPCCWVTGLDWIRASGRGRIVSFSLVHRGISDAFANELPILLAEIELAEGALMIARVIAPDVTAVKSGLAVQTVPLPDARRYPLPTFVPAA